MHTIGTVREYSIRLRAEVEQRAIHRGFSHSQPRPRMQRYSWSDERDLHRRLAVLSLKALCVNVE